MSEVLKFAGKTDNNTVKGVSVSNDGYVRTERVWNIDSTEVFNARLTSTSEVYATSYNASKSGMIALEVYNFSGVDISIRIGNPIQSVNNAVKNYNASGEVTAITIPSTSQRCIITPEDIPALNYCKYVNISITALSSPSVNDVVRVFVLDKR